MPWIQNVSMDEVNKGAHRFSAPAVLIQIADNGLDFPDTKFPFSKIIGHKFLDLEFEDTCTNGTKITQIQAADIVKTLKWALDNDHNVIVHCVVGICRSGAVAEVGVMMGFEDTHRFRQPNLMVKNMLMRELGWTYN